MIKTILLVLSLLVLVWLGRLGFQASESSTAITADAQAVAACVEDARSWRVMAGSMEQVRRQDALQRWAVAFHAQARPATRAEAASALIEAARLGDTFTEEDLAELNVACDEVAAERRLRINYDY